MNDLTIIILLAIIPIFVSPLLAYIITNMLEKTILFMKRYISIKRLFFVIFYILIYLLTYTRLINWVVTY